MTREARKWYTISAAAGDKATIRIYGDIGESWWDDNAVSASSFSEELDEVGSVGQLEVHLNSPGGVAFDGVTIYNLLKDHPARVTVYVDGLAASAASIIAMAGDEVIMGTGAQMMIHDASIMTWGNADQLRKDADVVDSLSISMASIYAERAGGDAAAWRTVMKGEQWYTADEAVEAGLADRRSTKDNADGDTADVAAMLRASATARRFRFQGRAQAPTPQTPATAGGSETTGGTVEIADEDFAALRETLGLSEDATVGDVLEAVKPKEQTDESTPDQAAASLPDGVVAIDKGVLADLQASAALGVEAHKAQQKAEREALVTAALRDGKIRAADKGRWLKNLELDPEGFTAVLASLEPGLVPVAEKGHDDGTLEEGDGVASLDEARKSPHYNALKGIV